MMMMTVRKVKFASLNRIDGSLLFLTRKVLSNQKLMLRSHQISDFEVAKVLLIRNLILSRLQQVCLVVF